DAAKASAGFSRNETGLDLWRVVLQAAVDAVRARGTVVQIVERGPGCAVVEVVEGAARSSIVQLRERGVRRRLIEVVEHGAGAGLSCEASDGKQGCACGLDSSSPTFRLLLVGS